MLEISYLGEKVLDAKILKLFGGKAAKLHELKQDGFPVPAGFVLQAENSELSDPIKKIGGFPVAVRSSCSMEDLPNASFAGLYETFLFVKNHEELQSTIKQCFDSRSSHRVKDYLKTKGIKANSDQLHMSVLVQKMVDAKAAGVLFTLNPTNGKEEECYVEYCTGVGERLVSGHVTPTRCHYNWIHQKILSHEVNAEGTLLDETLLKKMMFTAIKIQAKFEVPQDIEWAIDEKDEIFILQSRPITTFFPREDYPEITNADFKDGGVSARVCTPLMYSIYRDAVSSSMGDYFKKIKLIPNDEKIQWTYYSYGRVYWNASAVKEGLRKLPDFKEVDFDRDLGIQKDYGEAGPHVTSLSLAAVVNAIPVLIGLHKEFRDCELMVNQFRETFEKKDAEFKKKKGDFFQWLSDVIQFQQQTETSYFRTIYNNANYQSEFRNYLKKLPGYLPGDMIDLMGELHGVSHLDVQSGLAELRRISDLYGFESESYFVEREKFLKVHYHHGPAELDLTVARWGENKKWVDGLVRDFIATNEVVGHFHKTYLRLSESAGFKRGKFERMLKTSRNFLRMREEMRSYSTRAYYLLRQGILEFAKRFELKDLDVFMFHLSEIKNVNKGLPDISIRKLHYQGYKNFKAPNEFGGMIRPMTKSMDESLVGLGCSPGEIIGIARVIVDIHLTSHLTKKDILVTVFTDPGWTPVLARVGGVVTEVGGLLSHAAVIGREYGIPAILNLMHATEIIQDGDKIKMNGKTGVVEILEKRS